MGQPNISGIKDIPAIGTWTATIYVIAFWR